MDEEIEKEVTSCLRYYMIFRRMYLVRVTRCACGPCLYLLIFFILFF